MLEHIPRIVSAEVIGKTELVVHFDNGVDKVYDVAPLLTRPQFQLLRTPAFFAALRVDVGGYGISWNDDIDISEYEIWTNGKGLSERSLQPTLQRGQGVAP